MKSLLCFVKEKNMNQFIKKVTSQTILAHGTGQKPKPSVAESKMKATGTSSLCNNVIEKSGSK